MLSAFTSQGLLEHTAVTSPTEWTPASRDTATYPLIPEVSLVHGLMVFLLAISPGGATALWVEILLTSFLLVFRESNMALAFLNELLPLAVVQVGCASQVKPSTNAEGHDHALKPYWLLL